MVIRKYKPSDRFECIEIFKSNMPLFFDPEELLDFEKWLNGKDQGILGYSNTIEEYYYVAELENKIIACGGFYIPKDEKRANMTWGMVDNKLHKKGIGQKLLEYRIKIINAQHPGYQISLDTTQHSYKFFEKMGFTLTKITKDFYVKGMHRYDMIK